MTPKAVYDETRQKAGQCSSCECVIIWRFNTVTQKASPWDNPKMCSSCEGSGGFGVGCADCEGVGWFWISHFATCPNANAHRRVPA